MADERCDAEDRRRDLADGLELRREKNRVGDDDQPGGERARALAGEARADVIGHRQRAEAAQLRRDETADIIHPAHSPNQIQVQLTPVR